MLINNITPKPCLQNLVTTTSTLFPTPTDPYVPLFYPPPNDSDTLVPSFPYQEIVESLLYVASHSRRDIAHAVSVVAQSSTNFWEIHCTAMKRILKYHY